MIVFSSKQHEYTEETHKEKGIDVDFLTADNSLRYKQAFFTILQGQLDNFHYFYHEEERKLVQITSHVKNFFKKLMAKQEELEESHEQDDLKIILMIEKEIRKSISNLRRFIAESKERFIIAIKAFDEYHGSSVEEEELESLEENHEFINGRRLNQLVSLLDELSKSNCFHTKSFFYPEFLLFTATSFNKEMKETLSFMKKEDGVLCIDKGRSRNSSRQVKEYLRSKNSSICSANERKYISAENVSNYTMQSTKSSSNVSKLDSASCQENISSSKSFAKSFFGKLRRKKKAQRQYTPTI